ncbi:Morn repeat protein [Pandoravirus kuranda]|uniref:Morn repeat protein n=1 Tax=Pandoravirus kuranda TaxID=3019033 RepID=A0AA95J288_9VIRU|nr:Morn repeat protein [Pandoravirus kuranda]
MRTGGDAFSWLPDELVLAVLERIANPRDLVHFGTASRRLHAISLDDSLWRAFFEQRHHTLDHVRFAEFGKTWRWVLRLYSSVPLWRQILPRGVSGVWHYSGDTDAGGWPHGYGIGRRDGRCYEGEWKGGFIHGHGTTTFEDGAVHRGAWSFGAACGHGARTYADGSHYVGQWRLGMRHGHGAHTLANGDVYDGPWRWNEHHGSGTTATRGGGSMRGTRSQTRPATGGIANAMAFPSRTWSQVVQQQRQQRHETRRARDTTAVAPKQKAVRKPRNI